MKVSPIFSTACAVAIMLVGYLCMQWLLHHTNSNQTVAPAVAESTPSGQPISGQAAFLEMHFSTPPTSVCITDPLSKTEIIRSTNLIDYEWSDEINLPVRRDLSTLELSVKVTWNNKNSTKTQAQHFIQIILSPEQQADATVTLRSFENIDDTAIFQWQKES